MLANLLKKRALEIGFDLAGIAPISAWKDLEFSRRWVEQGYAGEMRYLENPKRHDPRSILSSAQSVICVGLVYNAPLPYSTEVVTHGRAPLQASNSESRAWISRYAWGQDYHRLMRSKLEKLRHAVKTMAADAETRVFVDTGPVVERAFARLSGIGWTGKNTCLINEQKGSWFFLGVILTSLDLDADSPAPDRCGSCTRCIEACPTGALVEPYVMDASRCIAYFTIELKGSIPSRYRAAIGNNVIGCDICQDVCPWNGNQNGESPQPSALSRQPEEKGRGRTGAATTTLPEFQPLQVELSPPAIEPQPSSTQSPAPGTFSLFHPRPEDLLALSEDDFRRVFMRSPIKRAKYHGLLRNLCVVMGNSGDRGFAGKLQELSRHSDPVIREHAEWALARLEAVAAPSAREEIVRDKSQSSPDTATS